MSTVSIGPCGSLPRVWSSFQLALAALDRISEVLALESDMPLLSAGPAESRFRARVPKRLFSISRRQGCAARLCFELEKGKAYALVGPTGGGKTTTASLMARLYDPTEGSIFLDGRDIRSVRARRALAEGRFYSAGAVFVYRHRSRQHRLWKRRVSRLLQPAIGRGSGEGEPFEPDGAFLRKDWIRKSRAAVTASAWAKSSSIAFMRATLRRPELLILDEATANIDTVTEQLFEEILDKLPPETTKVIIAHRLNTIDNVDQIYFVNSGAESHWRDPWSTPWICCCMGSGRAKAAPELPETDIIAYRNS